MTHIITGNWYASQHYRIWFLPYQLEIIYS